MLKFIYMIFVASIMVGNGIYLGPCTTRQYCAILLSIYCFINYKLLRSYTLLLPQYLFFIFLFGLSSALDGFLSQYFKSLIALYYVSIIAYFSTIIILNKYKSLDCVFIPILSVGLINAIIIFLQYIGNPIGYAIGSIFIDMNNESQLNHFIRMTEGNKQNLFGIMGDIVYNGYYMMIMPFILLIKSKKYNKVITHTLLIIFLIALFMVGEKSCFGITLILICLLYIHKQSNYSMKIIMIFSLAVLALILFLSLFESNAIQDSRYLSGNSEIRDTIKLNIYVFIFSHPLLGGYYKFLQICGWPPHNVIASGFIYGGFIGGVLIIYILFRQSKICLFLYKREKDMPITLAFIAYTANGLFHNPAIVTGDAMVWILWGVVYYSYLKYKNINKDDKRRISSYFNYSPCI